MDVNFFGAVAITKFILPHFLKKRSGYFVVVSSLTGKFGTPYRSGYAASKHALHGFFDAVRAEHFKDSIKVSMICPGFVHTTASYAALTGDGMPANPKIEEGKYKGMPSNECAKKIVSAMESEKEEVYIGGREVWGVYLKRFLPTIFSRVIRTAAVR
jgi:short-subunit dehydrogenase